MKIKKWVYISIGCLNVVLGVIGVIVPLLPAFPFLLLAMYCFSKSSKCLHDWFISTNLYKKNLESYVVGQGMTWKVKIRIMIMITLLMFIGFVMMGKVPLGQLILCIIWIFHILYFIFGIKNKRSE